MPKTYWPETEPIEDASFVSNDDGNTWTPLCCGKPMTYRFTPWSNWDCSECGVRHLIWAEDWPNYEECELVLDGHDTDGTPWSRCVTHDKLVIGTPDDGWPYCEEG